MVIALAVISVSGIVFARITNSDISPANLRAMLFQLGALAPLVLVSALAGVLVIPVIPASIFQVGAGLAFGSWLGLSYVVIADLIGASVGFAIARYWGKILFAHYLDTQTQSQLANLAERISWRGVILLRLLPGPAYPLVSFASGYSSISYPTYIVASFIGVFPGLVLLVLAGDMVEQSPLLAFGLVALVLVGLVIAGHGLSEKKTSSEMSYSSDYFTTRESWRDWHIEARLLIDAAHVTQETRVLEIGCGGGGLLRMVVELGACAVGVDTLDVALELARGRNAPTERLYAIQIGEDNALPFRDASFDAIIAQHAIEHLPEVDTALSEWKRLLKPQGRISLATPNALYPDPAHFADAAHAQVFSPDELRAAVQRFGFVVDACSTIFPFLSRLRPFRAFGVIMYRIFQHAPYFGTHGRTILLSARKEVTK